MFRFLLKLAILLPLLSTPAIAQVSAIGPSAQDQPRVAELPEPLTPEAVRALVSRLSDAEVRALLLQRLDAVARIESDRQGGSPLLEFLETAALGNVNSVVGAIRALPLLWERQSESFRNFGDHLGFDGVAGFIGLIALAVLAGVAVEFLFNRATRRWRDRALIATNQDRTFRGQVTFLARRLAIELAGLVAFLVTTRIIIAAALPTDQQPFAAVIMVNVIALPRLLGAFTRFFMAPRNPHLRLVHTDDATAKMLHRNLVALFALGGLSVAMVTFNDMNGVSMGESRLGFWLNIAVHIYIVAIAWRARNGLSTMLIGRVSEATPMEVRVARAYPWYAIAVSVSMWLIVNTLAAYGMFALLQTAPHYATMLVLLTAPALDTLVRGVVKHIAPPMTGEGALAARAYESTKRSYIRIGRILVFGAAIVLIARIWDIDFQNLAAASVGAVLAAKLLQFLVIIAAGYLVWEIASLWINSRLAREQSAADSDTEPDEPGGGEGGGTGVSRISTVLPLILGVLKVTIAVVTALVALGQAGIDTTPLLAGAGIVGLAVGFGAQKLVGDVVSGIFFLLDDAFRAGEYVEVAGTLGTVEKISIRSLQLRHHKGPVHTIPYGEIPKLTNYSRDWVIMKLKFTVPFDTDPNKVKKIFKKIGAEMIEMPEFANDMLQPFKSQGVYDVDDVGIVIRGKFMAKPGKQFTLRKEVYNRVKKAFEENGIDFARREVRVRVEGVEDRGGLDDSEKEAIAAAAADAARQTAENEAAPSGARS